MFIPASLSKKRFKGGLYTAHVQNVIKFMKEFCGNGKDKLIALATISLSPNAADNPSPAVHMGS